MWDISAGEGSDNAIGLTTEAAYAALDPTDLNLVLIEEVWGEESVDWWITTLCLAETDPAEIAENRRLADAAATAAVVSLPVRPRAAPRRRSGVQRAA